jgi:hypothetical protein
MSTAFPLSTLGFSSIPEGAIRVYPNPAHNVLHIEAPVAVRAILTQADGRIIAEVPDAREMDLSGLPAGLYLLTLNTDDGMRLCITRVIKD